MDARTLEKVLAPVKRAVRNAVARAVVKSVDDSSLAQILEVLATADETVIAEHFQPYGLTAHPVPGSEAVLLTVAGDRSQAILLSVMRREQRPTDLAEGEVALYTGSTAQVLLRTNGAVEIGSPNGAEMLVKGTTLQDYFDTQLGPWIERVHTALLALATAIQALPAGPILNPPLGVPFAALATAIATPPVPTVPAIESAKHKMDA